MMRETELVSGNISSTQTDGGDTEEILESQLLLEESGSGIMYTEWSTEPQCSLNDSESEEALMAINPNEVYTSAAAPELLSESDSGVSEDQSSDPQNLTGPPPAVYQVIYDISSLGSVITEQQPPHTNVISIDLDEWRSHMLLSDSCVVNELLSSVRMEKVSSEETHMLTDDCLVYPELQLTDEEQKLLDEEGVSLPNNLPLTKAEERILKKVRRKIRNKLSAQDSRRRKKEYIDGLESRVAACSAQNKELQRTVEQLEKHNMSLVSQLRKLQTLIKQTATKAAQTSTCVMILIFSLGLIILPSVSPFRWSGSEDETYSPSGVISRNILNDVPSLPLLEDVGEDEPVLSKPLSFHADRRRSDAAHLLSDAPPAGDATLEQGPGPQPSARENQTTVTKPNTNTAAAGFIAPVAGNAATDAAKPPHADEM